MCILFKCLCYLKHQMKHLTDNIKLGLNIALAPANMARLSFGPCKKKNSEISPLKKFCLLKIPLDPFKP